MTNMKCLICGKELRYKSDVKKHASVHGIYLPHHKTASIKQMLEYVKFSVDFPVNYAERAVSSVDASEYCRILNQARYNMPNQ